MAEQRTTGIILRTMPLTETSLIVHWLTPDFGRISTVAKGARRAKSNFHGRVDVFHTADFTFIESRKSDLHTLKEIALRETFPALRRDMLLLQRAAYGSALIGLATESDTPLAEIYELYLEYLRELPNSGLAGVLALECRLLEELGLSPEATELSGEPRALLGQFLTHSFAELATHKFPDASLKLMSQFLHGFIVYHLGKLPKGRMEAITTET